MQLTITVTGPDGASYDIQADSGQHIKTTVRVLSETIEGLAVLGDGAEVRVKKSGRRLDPGKTYREEEIYTGEELILKPRGGALYE